MFKLRPYQSAAEAAIYEAWRDAQNVALVLPTGSGKTVLFTDIIRQHKGASCVIAHRQELVAQISLALAREEVRHKIIGPPSIIRLCVSQHMSETGQNYYDSYASCAVAGIDTLIRRGDALRSWSQSVTLCVMDETHHLLRENKWGKGIELFPNARVLGVTATFSRTDGKGLGRAYDGIFDAIVNGPTMRELINAGYLTDYRLFGPNAHIDLSNVPVSKTTGDYTPAPLKIAVRKSRIIGDVVEHYLRIAPGKLGVTFATDVETAADIAANFRAHDVPAEMVCAETSDKDRIAAIRKFRSRQILQLVNVDLFGEGFDLPAVEVVSMARPTASRNLYVQQFGRGLRPMEGKPCAIIIDHVSNVMRHGLPDAPCKYTLERRSNRDPIEQADAEPLRTCPQCTGVYSRYLTACPYCGYHPIPQGRNGPEFVDGDLLELDAETLAKMRGEVYKIDMPASEYKSYLESRHVPYLGVLAGIKRHAANKEMQAVLRDSIAWWAGWQRSKGRDDHESYKRFYHKFGIDVMSAKALHATDAEALNEKIKLELNSYAGT